MWEKFKSTLVREGKGWYKLWSNQFAVLMGAAAAFAAENQQLVIGYFDSIPQPWRSGLAFVVATIIPIWLRMKRQPSLMPDIGQK